MYATLAYINIVICLLGIVAWIAWSLRNTRRWRYSVAPLSILVHVILFYIGVLLGIDNRFVTIWSNGVRLHGVVLFAVAGMYLALEKRKKWKSRK